MNKEIKMIKSLFATSAKSAGSIGLKIVIISAATLGGAALVSSSVFAALTATAANTSAQTVTSGTLQLTQVASGSASSAGFTSQISNIAPGDTVNRHIDLKNATLGAVYLFQTSQKMVVTDTSITPGPQALDADHLRSLVISKGLVVYWLGPRSGATYVLNTSLAGGVSLREIDNSSGTSDPIQTYYEIGTFVIQNAFEITQKAALQPYGVGFINVDGNAVYYDTRDPKNVYVGLKGADIVVQIYDPRADQALAAALMQGNIKRIV